MLALYGAGKSLAYSSNKGAGLVGVPAGISVGTMVGREGEAILFVFCVALSHHPTLPLSYLFDFQTRTLSSCYLKIERDIVGTMALRLIRTSKQTTPGEHLDPRQRTEHINKYMKDDS